MAFVTDESASGLRQHRVGSVAVLTLDRPEVRNALSPALLGALQGTLADLAADVEVAAVVLTGAGDRAFCSGMDLKAFSEATPGAQSGIHLEPGDPVLARDYPKPMVAAVNGAAVAGGFELVLSCDLVVASADAVFALAEVRRGLIAAGGGTMLGTRIPLAAALEITLLGDPISAQRAFDLGLVNRVVAADAVLDTALDLAARLASNGPLAMKLTKQLVRGAVDRGPEHGRPTGAQIQEIFSSADAQEGACAFVEKREPRWTGR